MANQVDENHIGAARIFGFAYICAFLSYGTGNALIDGYFMAADPIAAIQADSTTLTHGIVLMAIIHSLTNVTVAGIMYKILAPFSKFLSTGFVLLAIIATVALLVGAGLLAMVLPLGLDHSIDTAQANTLVGVLFKGNFYFYQAGMTLWGVGGILMCLVLLRTKLVPRWLPICGVVGYVIFVFGTISEFYGSGIGVMLSLPGGLFEVTLGIWLIFKGFDYRYTNEMSAA